MTDEERRLYESAIRAKDTAIRALVEENRKLTSDLVGALMARANLSLRRNWHDVPESEWARINGKFTWAVTQHGVNDCDFARWIKRLRGWMPCRRRKKLGHPYCCLHNPMMRKAG